MERNPSSSKKLRSFFDRLQVSQDYDTKFLTISIKHESPHIAKEWTELVVNQINDSFRAKDKLEAESAMNFLNSQMALTSYTEIKQVVAQILKQKMQQLALIETNEFYVFSYLDQPAVARKNRAFKNFYLHTWHIIRIYAWSYHCPCSWLFQRRPN